MNDRDQTTASGGAPGWSSKVGISRQRLFFAGFCFGLAPGIAVGTLISNLFGST